MSFKENKLFNIRELFLVWKGGVLANQKSTEPLICINMESWN